MSARPNNPKQTGFTLIELLISMAILSIVIGAITSMWVNMSSSLTEQSTRTDLQQSLRASIDFMAEEIKMAGFTPSVNDKDDFALKNAQATEFDFKVDWDADGELDPTVSGGHDSEHIKYYYDSAEKSLKRRTAEGTTSQDTQPLMGGNDDRINITRLNFTYFNQANNVTTNIDDVRAVQITLVAEGPAGKAGMIEKSFTTKVRCRNLGR